MTNSTQIAAVLIGATLSAFTVCCNVDPAIAGTSPAPINEAASPAPTFQPAPELRGRAYVFRGVLGNIFSTGMDRLTKRIKAAGIPAQVYSFTVCQIIARDAIREYRRDPAPIILVGHSAGAFCTLRFAETLRKENISVSLIVDFDPPRVCPPVPMNVERYINVFMSDAPLGGGEVFPIQGYAGHFASFDMKHLDLTHVTIDKSETIHEQIVAKMREVAMPFARVERDAAPLRFVLPANAPIELWDSGTHVFARPGDTLESLAAFHRVPLWSIAQINRLSPDGAPLVPGQAITVPRYLVPLTATASPLKPRP
jgi:hypothetical protein